MVEKHRFRHRICASVGARSLNVVFDPLQSEWLRHFAVNARESSRAPIAEGNNAEDFVTIRISLNKEWTAGIPLGMLKNQIKIVWE